MLKQKDVLQLIEVTMVLPYFVLALSCLSAQHPLRVGGTQVLALQHCITIFLCIG